SGETTLVPAGAAGGDDETLMGQVVGTPSYMAPEQASGRWDRVGPCSDIFSLGATLYAALTGQAPIQGSDQFDVLERSRRGEWLPPRQVKKEVPKALEAICQRAMAADPAKRYQSANDL